MSRQQKLLEKKKLGRPAIGKGVQVNMQLRPSHADALDKWRESQDPPIPSRSQAARQGIAEWLISLGFLQASKDSDHPKPTGPATDVVDKMDAAIEEHRSGRKKGDNG